MFIGSLLAWSTDGTKIAFVSEHSDGAYLSILDVETEHTTPVFKSPAPPGYVLGNILWSPNNEWISFYIRGGSGSNVVYDAWVVSSDGQRSAVMGSAIDLAHWSMDSTFVIFRSYPTGKFLKFSPADGSGKLIDIPSKFRNSCCRYNPILDAFIQGAPEQQPTPKQIEFNIIDANSFELLDSVALPGQGLTDFEVSPDGNWLIAWISQESYDYEDAITYVFSFTTRSTITIPEVFNTPWFDQYGGRFPIVSWTPDGRGMIVARGPFLNLVDLETGATVFQYYSALQIFFFERHYAIFWQSERHDCLC